MEFWLDLFTGRTWDEFRDAGERISGFRERMRNSARKVNSGDVLLCYLTGVKRWVGALRVVKPTSDSSEIWKGGESFPVRFEVEPLVTLDAKHGVPMEELFGKVDFFQTDKDRGGFKAFLRMSPNRFKRHADGELILSLLKAAKQSPVTRPVDPKQYNRQVRYTAERRQGRKRVPALVTVPTPDETEDETSQAAFQDPAAPPTRHTEIQHMLLRLGSELGLDVWVARNDRNKIWQGELLGELPRVVQDLPTQFNEATTKTIELIDVLWLRKNSIAAAFEVECTTSIYSGLLRMSDLLALQPDIDIKLFLVAPDERRTKVEQEITRPTFVLRDKPLNELCGFLAFSTLTEKVQGIRNLGLIGSLKPDFLEQTAEYFETE